MKDKLNICILDLYDGYPNEGMRCIKMLIDEFLKKESINGNFSVYDVRSNAEYPDIDNYQIFISTGGPGSPMIEGEEWEMKYFNFLDQIIQYNAENAIKKHLLLICHSYQLMVQRFSLGLVCKRISTSFGVMPIHKTTEGQTEPLFEGLEDPFWAVDSRDYQVIQPDLEKIDDIGAKIVALEKYRPHIPLERAIMGIRLTDEIVGFQFHPEADALGMSRYFQQEEKRSAVIAEHGEDKLEIMLEQLEDPDKIILTEATIIPTFLKNAAEQILCIENSI